MLMFYPGASHRKIISVELTSANHSLISQKCLKAKWFELPVAIGNHQIKPLCLRINCCCGLWSL